MGMSFGRGRNNPYELVNTLLILAAVTRERSVAEDRLHSHATYTLFKILSITCIYMWHTRLVHAST